jgi:hypothetical protein
VVARRIQGSRRTSGRGFTIAELEYQQRLLLRGGDEPGSGYMSGRTGGGAVIP